MSDQRTRPATTAELESVLRRELTTDRWAAAETAYALAVLHREQGDWTASRVWVRQCLRLLDGFPADTEEQVATRRTAVGGVPIPAYLHEGVVRARFGDPG
ncbi:hypothetical protein [Streptomyces qinzhouensis]|uniref:Tetratricopeptide repeat protein n=1 Tax=Streptomyces qinzhouensis TaxID=2599401 RepID=A0A5B8II74_9ACTN|nr:hypothetical protein [Streptomyces qinzhouensis]QDY78072.1 hypothetical protein FQU76_17930 [Streptomyces qinzhouensis]